MCLWRSLTKGAAFLTRHNETPFLFAVLPLARKSFELQRKHDDMQLEASFVRLPTECLVATDGETIKVRLNTEQWLRTDRPLDHVQPVY